MQKYQICGSFFHFLLSGLLHRWVKCILEVRNMKNGSCTSIFNFLLPKCQTGKWVKNTATCFLNYLVTLVVRNIKAWPICCFILLGGHMKKRMDQQYTDQLATANSINLHPQMWFLWTGKCNTMTWVQWDGMTELYNDCKVRGWGSGVAICWWLFSVVS